MKGGDEMAFVITEQMVRKLLSTVDAGLVAGVGVPHPGKMCVEAAISYALGEPHSDGPSCVDPTVRHAKIGLNDAIWSSNMSRARGMRRVAIAQLGSRGEIDVTKFVTLLAEYTIREVVPLALRVAARVHPSRVYREKLEACASACGAASGASDAASHAARAASHAASDASHAANEIDAILCLSASLMVRALQECGSPGCEWLWLADATGSVNVTA